MAEAIRRITAKGQRDRPVVAIFGYAHIPFVTEKLFLRGLRKAGLDHADALVLGYFDRPPGRRVIGAESDMFPHMSGENQPGIVSIAATAVRRLLKARKMPPGEQPLTAPDCCWFALSHPSVDVCMTGARTLARRGPPQPGCWPGLGACTTRAGVSGRSVPGAHCPGSVTRKRSCATGRRAGRYPRMPLDSVREPTHRTPELRSYDSDPAVGTPPVKHDPQDLDAALDELAEQSRVDPRERLRPSAAAPDPPPSLGQRMVEWLLGPSGQCELNPNAPSSQTGASAPRGPGIGAIPGPRLSDGRYTTHPAEVVAKRTPVGPQELKAALRQLWPALSERGAEVLVAQSATETGNWKNCYNYNLGNTKRPDAPDKNLPHMYLLHSYEPGTQARLTNEWGTSGDLVARDPSRAHQAAVPKKHIAIEYAPPHRYACFQAYSSLNEGIAAWCNGMKARVNKDPSLLQSLNSSDTLGVAHALARQHYFGVRPEYYAQALQSKLRELLGR